MNTETSSCSIAGHISCNGDQYAVLTAADRKVLGSSECGRLRKLHGLVPAIVYSRGNGTSDVRYISVTSREISREYTRKNIVGRVFNLINENGVKELVVLYDITIHPSNGSIEHIEFYAIKNGSVFARVPVVFFNHESSLPVKRGAFLNVLVRTITMTCAFDEYPEKIAVDLKDVELGQSYRVGDLPLPSGCILHNCSKDTLVAKFMGKKAVAKQADGANKDAATKSAPKKAPEKTAKAKTKAKK